MIRNMIGLQILLVLLAVPTGCSMNSRARGFTEKKFDKIKIGMTEAQVKELLGKPLRVVRIEDRLYKVKIASGRIVEEIISYDEREVVVEAHGYITSKRHLDPGISRVQAEGILHCKISKAVGVRCRWVYADASPIPMTSGANATIEFGYDGKVKDIRKNWEAS